MKQRECEGILKFHSGQTSSSRLISMASKTKNWLQARGKLYLPIGSLPAHEPGKWQVGEFHCKKDEHQDDNDIFMLSATNNGELIKNQHTKFEERMIDVSIIRVSQHSGNHDNKPRIYKYDG